MAKKKETQSTPKSDILTDFEKQFVDIWFNMGFKNRLSYKQLKPNVTNETADTEASKLLSLPKVQDYVDLKHEQIRIKEEVKLDWIVSELKSIVYEVKQQQEERDQNGRLVARKDTKSALAALAQLSRLAGLDTKKVDVNVSGEMVNKVIKVNFKDPNNEE